MFKLANLFSRSGRNKRKSKYVSPRAAVVEMVLEGPLLVTSGDIDGEDIIWDEPIEL